MVAYNMSGWRDFARLVKRAPKSDIVVLVVTFLLTIFFDLVVAIEVGIAIAVLLFMKRMADVSEVRGWEYVDDEDEDLNDPEQIGLRMVPKDTLVYEINGPMFFGAADAFLDIIPTKETKKIILRMRSVPAMDASGLHILSSVYERCQERGITLIFSHVNEQPLHSMEKSGLYEKVGKDNFCGTIDDALLRGSQI